MCGADRAHQAELCVTMRSRLIEQMLTVHMTRTWTCEEAKQGACTDVLPGTHGCNAGPTLAGPTVISLHAMVAVCLGLSAGFMMLDMQLPAMLASCA